MMGSVQWRRKRATAKANALLPAQVTVKKLPHVKSTKTARRTGEIQVMAGDCSDSKKGYYWALLT